MLHCFLLFLSLCYFSVKDIRVSQSWDSSGYCNKKEEPRRIYMKQKIRVKVSNLISRLERAVRLTGAHISLVNN